VGGRGLSGGGALLLLLLLSRLGLLGSRLGLGRRGHWYDCSDKGDEIFMKHCIFQYFLDGLATQSFFNID
jgi:hypothetical protein